MTQASRLILNTVVSYSRSLLALFLGLFSARGVLQALGQDDFGLYGVVGSLLASISFFNVSLSGSISRFYAFSIGAANNMDKLTSERELRGWFNAALVIHFTLALFLILVGLPLGEYAIRNILVIPQERMAACIWVFRLSVLSSLVGLIFVPYCAFYTAYQYIAELTMFEMIRTLLNFLCAFLLLHVKSDRLLAYSLMMASISVMVSLAQLWRAQYQFPVRMSLHFFHFDFSRVKEVLRYGFLKLMGVLGWLFKAHGSAFVINLSFSPRENATYSLANQVVVHASALAASMVNAIAPALTTLAGAGETEKMRLYAIRTCKISGGLVALFAIPLVCEMDYILTIWLKTPPPNAVEVCSLFLIAFLIDTMSVGCMTAISTNTRIGVWQFSESLILISSVPILWICYRYSFPFFSIGHVFIFLSILIVGERLYFSKRIVGMSPRIWLRQVLMPVGAIIVCGYACGMLMTAIMPKTVWRLISVTSTIVVITGLLFWAFVMDSTEKQLLIRFLGRFVHRRPS